MSAYGGNDVQERLYDLEEEERRIMQELDALDAEAPPPPPPGGARAALNALLADCEREVRAAKGYIKAGAEPLQILRVRPGARPPKTATFLSRPRDTGVDFTVPVVLPEYLAVIKHPVFLNDVRDKCGRTEYSSAEDYLEDMRLLARNTAAFNKGEQLSWVVQHARLLLEAAEDAVGARRDTLAAAEARARAERAAPSPGASSSAMLPPPGKRRRSGGGGGGGGVPPVARGNGAASDSRVPPPPPPGAASAQAPSSTVLAGSRLFVLWPDDMTWYTARVVKKISVHRAEVEYDDDQTRQVLDLRLDKWRPMLPSAAARAKKGEPAGKRHKVAAAAAAAAAGGSAVVSYGGGGAGGGGRGGVSRAELDEVVEGLSARMDGVKDTLLGEIGARFDRVERALQRSDAMTRVLLLVHELSDIVTESTQRLETSMGGIAKHLRGAGSDASKDSDAAKDSDEEKAAEAGDVEAEAGVPEVEARAAVGPGGADAYVPEGDGDMANVAAEDGEGHAVVKEAAVDGALDDDPEPSGGAAAKAVEDEGQAEAVRDSEVVGDEAVDGDATVDGAASQEALDEVTVVDKENAEVEVEREEEKTEGAVGSKTENQDAKSGSEPAPGDVGAGLLGESILANADAPEKAGDAKEADKTSEASGGELKSAIVVKGDESIPALATERKESSKNESLHDDGETAGDDAAGASDESAKEVKENDGDVPMEEVVEDAGAGDTKSDAIGKVGSDDNVASRDIAMESSPDEMES